MFRSEYGYLHHILFFTLHTFRSRIISHTLHGKLPECDAFSDEEDSDEEDSEYEEVRIPKKKQAKRKRWANEAASSKRVKPNPKSQIHIPKKLVPRAMPNKQTPKKQPWVSMDMPGPPRPPYKTVQTEHIETLIHPFLKIIREGTNCILLWPCDWCDL